MDIGRDFLWGAFGYLDICGKCLVIRIFLGNVCLFEYLWERFAYLDICEECLVIWISVGNISLLGYWKEMSTGNTWLFRYVLKPYYYWDTGRKY